MKVLPEGQVPYIETDKRPEEILGEHYKLFVRHFRAWAKCEGSEAYMSKAFGQENRELIGKLNQELLYNGYRVDRVLDSGEIKWLVITVSDSKKRRRN